MDVVDQADEVQVVLMRQSFSKLNRQTEAPEFDESGRRICLECGVVIPLARVEAIDAVCCVDCAEYQEKKRSRFA